jgi:hypothetical protein
MSYAIINELLSWESFPSISEIFHMYKWPIKSSDYIDYIIELFNVCFIYLINYIQ